MPPTWHGYIIWWCGVRPHSYSLHPGLVMSSNNATYSWGLGVWVCVCGCITPPASLAGGVIHPHTHTPSPLGGRNSISIPAASYSPTRSLVQYHQRWKA